MPGTVTQTKTHNGVVSPDSTAQKGVIHAQAATAKKGVANGEAEVVKVGELHKSAAIVPHESVQIDCSSTITFRNDLPIPLYLSHVRVIRGHWDPRRSPPSYIPPYGVVKVTLKDNFGKSSREILAFVT